MLDPAMVEYASPAPRMEALAPLAIPAGAVITSVNGVTVDSGAALLAVVKKLAGRPRPTRLLVEYVRKSARYAIEYRIM